MESSSQLSPARQLDIYVDALPYVRKLLEEWKLIAAAMVLAILATALFDVFLATRWYLAHAVLRPIATSAVENRISGFSGALGGGAVSQLGGLASSLGGGPNDADEYIAILNGFSFNTALVERHHLAPELLRPSPLQNFLDRWSSSNPQWRIYRLVQTRFDCDYSRTTGNMELSYLAVTPSSAERILGYYISDLRDQLRSREINDASAAVASLREEAESTADPMMRSQLYTLEAKQLQRKKIAQVEADFAFRVLDAPAASDKKARPRITLHCIMAGLLAALVSAFFILIRFRPAQGEDRSIAFVRPVGITSRKADPAG
jgi:hypothetical protein